MHGYTGHVVPGGPPAIRELTHLMITKVSVGSMDNNVYLLRCRATGQQLLIDAAAEPDRLLTLIGTDGLAGIATTHRHADHVGALRAIADATACATYAHEDDADALPVQPSIRLRGGDRIAIGDVALEAIHLEGHTPGGLALVYDDPTGHAHLFVGDSLFPGGVGSTRGDPVAFERLLTDVRTRLFQRWPDETWVYPGHGLDTTLGSERPHLDQWAERGW